MTTRSGRPNRVEAAQLQERLRAAAVETILENGYDATTMEAVARAAGVTKRTLYARYPDKRALFAAIVPWALSQHQQDEPANATTSSDDPTEALLSIGRSAIARALDPEVVRLSRMAMMESARFPEFASSAHSLTWSSRMRAVMDVLRRHAEAGTVVIEDVELAAEQFLGLVSLMPARLAAFGVHRAPEVEEQHLQHAVSLFLRGVLAR